MEKDSIDFKKDENYEVDFEIKEDKTSNKPFIIKLIIFIIILLSCIIGYSRYLGTKGLIVIENKIEDKNIPDSFNGFKIVQFSDIHYGMTTSLNDIKKTINKINELKPDIIVFTGDLFDTDIKVTEDDVNKLKEEFALLDASINKYAVKGNEDYSFITEYETILKYADFTILDNNNELVYYKDNTPIRIVGTSSTLQDDFDINLAYTTIEEENNDYYTILLSHEPKVYNMLDANKANLILTCHSLGGLINIPFIGGIIKFEGVDNYTKGYYKENNTIIYVSSGIGTHKYNFRLFNKPSINLYRLYN